MKILIITLLSTLLTGCIVDNSPYRAANILLNINGQPCISVRKDTLTSERKSKLLVLWVSQRAADNTMQQVWKRNDMNNSWFIVDPDECLPIDYHFEKNREYGVTAVTAVAVNQPDTKQIWHVSFTMDSLIKTSIKG